MLQHLSTWSTFGGGWTARIVSVKSIAQHWAAEQHHLAPEPVAAHEDGGNAKAYASDVAQPIVDANDAVKAGVGGGGVGGVLEGAKDSIAPLSYSSPTMMKIYTGLTILIVLLSLGALLYSVWAHAKTKKARRAIDGDIMANVPEGQPA